MKNVFKFLPLFVFASFVSLLTGCGGSANKVDALKASIPPSEKSASEVFEVIDFLPGEELPSNVKYPSIQIQFSEPVIALQKLGDPSDKSPYVTIEPEIKGVFRWYGTSLLSFEASDPIIPQKEYTVKVAPDIQSAFGKAITGNLEYKFHTEPLKMTAIIPGYGEVQKGNYVDTESVPPEQARDIVLAFNAPVNPDHIKTQLKISAGSKTFSCSAKLETPPNDEDSDYSPNLVRLTLDSAPDADEDLIVELPEGSSSDVGCYPTPESQQMRFHTLKPFRLNSYTTDDIYYSEYTNPVEFHYSAILKSGQEKKIASLVSSSLDATITEKNIALRGKNLIIHSLPVKYDSTYTLNLAPGVEDIYGRKITEKESLTVKVPKAASYANFKNSGMNMLEAQFAPRLAFAFQNVKEGSYFNVTPLTKANGALVLNEKESYKELIDSGYPENTRIVKTVDLDRFLDKTSSGQYHGAVAFNADVAYEYRYRDWRTDQLVSEISHHKNEQIIQVTDLGMTVRYGYNKAAVLVTSLKTGEPVPNATVNIRKISWRLGSREVVLASDADNAIAEGRTDANGLAVINIPAGTFGSNNNDYIYIQAKTADDSAIFNPSSHNMWASSVDRVSSPDYAEDEEENVFIFTDRGLYKPGETMTFRIIDRKLRLGEYSPYQGNYTISLTDASWDSTVVATKDDRTTANGTGWGQFKIPDDIEPGTYCLKYSHSGVNETIYVQIQFFERLRFEVNSSIADMTYYSGDTLSATIAAQYLGGGSMGDSTYDAYWTRSPQGFRAKGVEFEKYSFGPSQGYDGTSSLDSDSGKLSADGKASVSVKTGGEKLKGMAYRYRMEASVSDSGNQSISSSAAAVVHPAKFYIGLSSAKNVSGFPKKGNPLKYDYVCVTPEGNAPDSSALPSGKKMKVELLREEWKEVQQLSWNGELTSRYQRSMVTESEQTINLSGSSKATEISVTPPKGGAYLIRLSTEDNAGNEIITERRQYVTGSDWTWFSRYNSEEIELTPDKDEYEVGEKAQILMQSPLPKGRYLITVEREGLLSQEVRVVNEPTTVLEFDIKENYVPIMYVAVSSYSTRTEPPATDYNTVDIGKPKGYFGVTALKVSTQTKRFNIDVKMDKALYKPGEKATIKIHASTKNGAVPNAEVTLMAVDRGVIDLINYHVPDPVEYFYNTWYFPECVRGGDSRSLLMDPITYTSNNLVGGDSDKLQERKNFDPTALFVPALITDKNGDAQYTFTLPDSLTAYRITAVGVDGNNFALAEDEMSVANPVSVRTVMPRKLRLGDVSEIGATLSNLEGTAHNVTITMNLYSGIEKTGIIQNPYDVQKLPGKASLEDKTTKSISVPAQSTKPLYFTIKGDEPGWITVEYIVKSDVVNEKILMPLEIEKPYIYETVATVGEVGRDEKQASGGEKLILPGDAEDNMGSLYVQLDPTRIGVLGEAVRYVFHYPYGCLEQRSAAILPLVAFGEYIDAFGLNSEVVNAKAVVENEIKNWASSQLSDGSFPYWPGGKYSSLYVSTRIGEILGIAKKKGINITSEIDLDDLADYLKRESYEYLEENSRYSWYSYDAVHSLYSASMLTSDIDESVIDNLLKERSDLDVSTLALCGLIYDNLGMTSKAKNVLNKVKAHIKLSTQGAEIAEPQFNGYWSFYYDQSEKFALALQLYSRVAHTDKTNQHLVYELLKIQQSNRGYWYSTAATARVLISMDEYIRANDLTKLDFTAEVLLNGKKLNEGSFKGVAAKAVDKTMAFNEDPIKDMPRDKELNLEFNKNGQGTLYYTVSMKYAIPAARQYARDEGICIFTEITDVKTGEVVSSDKLVAGNIYRERVYISSTRNREYVAVRAPIPAGAEVLNAAFVTTGTQPKVAGEEEDDDSWESYWRNYNWGLSYQGIYDSEVQYFWDYFPRGSQKVEFMFRATRKGTFNTPCSTAECMYQEEIFGRSNGKVWTIE